MKKINTVLMSEPKMFQLCFQLRQLNQYFGREAVFQELRADFCEDGTMLQVHIDNLYATFGVDLVNSATDMIFETELKKVG